METINRPLTPPSPTVKQSISTSNGGITSLPPMHDELNDKSHLERQQEHISSQIPTHTAPSAPSTAAISSSNSDNRNGNPFKETSAAPNPFSDVHVKPAAPARRSGQFERDTTSSHKSYTRNDTTHRIESEVLRILQWKDPVRSGAILAITVGSIILTRWYSLLQLSATALTLAIGVNLVYVNLILQSQKVLTNNDPAHPYNNVIHNEKNSMVDKASVRHYSTVITEVAETIVRALTRIIFIEDTVTSVKWMSIFFVIWKIAAHFSTMDIVLMVVISAFTFPRLYISNKDIVDAQLQKGQTMLQTGIEKAQTVVTENAETAYAKTRAYVAQVGTTGTDAKNTMSNESIAMKETSSL